MVVQIMRKKLLGVEHLVFEDGDIKTAASTRCSYSLSILITITGTAARDVSRRGEAMTTGRDGGGSGRWMWHDGLSTWGPRDRAGPARRMGW